MVIRMLSSVVSDSAVFQTGVQYDLPDERAAELIAAGRAEQVTQAIETKKTKRRSAKP